ncbi:NAD(P)H-dependent oxidoreductase [Zavarzinia aquatilis]|uniref:Dehydrogenase n=1 Tax=Zavarzinia aquatilis TaxID=2211142 RepID=A0A317E664_9PROT|nr:NAD(P)H-dependent oxidoreductase [Zavarzinia aquatilis]PWR22507.1 dehydrogenase [Zavarzinia aquatilis]
MPSKIVLIQGHPDKDGKRLCRQLADAYAQGVSDAGHQLRRIDLASLDFPLLASQYAYDHEPIPPGLAGAVADLLWADHIVLVFPLWMGTMPALVKAFFEQALRPGGTFVRDDKGGAQSLLAGRTARLVVTMGMPVPLFRFWFGGHGLKLIKRSILAFAGIRVVRHSLFGLVDTAGPDRIRGWLDEMRRAGASAH